MKNFRNANPNNYRRELQEQIDQQEANVAAAMNAQNAPATEGTATVDPSRDQAPVLPTQIGDNPRVGGDLPRGAPIQVPVQDFLPPVQHGPRPETQVSTDQRPADDQTQPTPNIGGRVALFSLPPRRPDLELRSRLDLHRARFEPAPAEGQPSATTGLRVHRPPSPVPTQDDHFDDLHTIQHHFDSMPIPFMMDAVQAFPRYVVQRRTVFMTSIAMATPEESERSVLRVRGYQERYTGSDEELNGGDETNVPQALNEHFPDDGLGLIPEEIYEHFLMHGDMQSGMAQRDIERRFPARECHDGDESPDCCICLCELEEGDLERRLPCEHTMHAACIDQWLESHLRCPMCRRDVRLQQS